MRQYQFAYQDGAVVPLATEAPMPEPGRGEVRVRVEAASLNYRDLIILDQASDGSNLGRVPLSDAAGRIDTIGPDVAAWQVGERVTIGFFRDWIRGPFRSRYMQSAFGGRTMDGLLAEYVVVPADALVRVPAGLSAEQAATLPCAAVTAWHGLVVRAGLGAGDTLLIQGTGGVALFALQFATTVGATAIILSSSDEKLAKARNLGASGLVNYRTTPDWNRAVREQTGGDGVSHILELGGPDTYTRSLNSLAAGGRIVQIGVLTGFGPKPDLGPLQSLNADIIGVTVGSVEHFRTMTAFIKTHGILPIIDRVFGFEDVAAAYSYLRTGQHFGKIVVRLL